MRIRTRPQEFQDFSLSLLERDFGIQVGRSAGEHLKKVPKVRAEKNAKFPGKKQKKRKPLFQGRKTAKREQAHVGASPKKMWRKLF